MYTCKVHPELLILILLLKMNHLSILQLQRISIERTFSDGNKRIAAFLFLWFLENNRILYRADGSRLLDNNTLVALTLMIAESRTEEKDVMTKVVVNLINKNN